MSWTLHEQVLPATGPEAHLDAFQAFGPSVLEQEDGTLRMWYSGHDGSTCRILEAVQPLGRPWERLGVSIDAGLAGESDAYGVESPSVVATPGGYLMAYAGSDGADTRLHMATSDDGHRWVAQGTFMQRGEADAVGATHPCLLVTSERWWLFYAGYDGSYNGRRAAILAAVSDSGASWNRLDSVLEPDDHERAVSEPCVLISKRRFSMLYVSDDGSRPTIQVATSGDGLSWDRRGVSLPGSEDDKGMWRRSPCLSRLHDGTLRLWFAGRPADQVEATDRIGSADLSASEAQLLA